MFQIFAGTPPFAHTPDSVLVSVVVDRGIRPRPTKSSIQNGLDDDYWKIVEDCWAQDPNDRPIITHVVQRLSGMRTRVADVHSPISEDLSPPTVVPSHVICTRESPEVDTSTSPTASSSSPTVGKASLSNAIHGIVDAPRPPSSWFKRRSGKNRSSQQGPPSLVTTDVKSHTPRSSPPEVYSGPAPIQPKDDSLRNGSKVKDKRKVSGSFSPVAQDKKRRRERNQPQKKEPKDPNLAVEKLTGEFYSLVIELDLQV
jgi:hypothetical protein